MSWIDDLLSVDSSIDQIHDFINQMGWDGEDSVTQLRLMDNGMVSFDEEKESIKELFEQYVCRVFATCEARFAQRKAWLHEKDQHGCKQHPYGIN